jgi:hypothetical protein
MRAVRLTAGPITLRPSRSTPPTLPQHGHEDRGLGTGEFDETLGVDLSKRLFDRLFGYVSLSYSRPATQHVAFAVLRWPGWPP